MARPLPAAPAAAAVAAAAAVRASWRLCLAKPAVPLPASALACLRCTQLVCHVELLLMPSNMRVPSSSSHEAAARLYVVTWRLAGCLV